MRLIAALTLFLMGCTSAYGQGEACVLRGDSGDHPVERCCSNRQSNSVSWKQCRQGVKDTLERISREQNVK